MIKDDYHYIWEFCIQRMPARLNAGIELTVEPCYSESCKLHAHWGNV